MARHEAISAEALPAIQKRFTYRLVALIHRQTLFSISAIHLLCAVAEFKEHDKVEEMHTAQYQDDAA